MQLSFNILLKSSVNAQVLDPTSNTFVLQYSIEIIPELARVGTRVVPAILSIFY